ncbi:hypothetical protein BJ165DRAFT_1400674 [Panaeolus papilionaceus]|nr:hypothetical protein BJ165DRAFT_1400674 [Panaeolus papilionaceus]
MSTLWEVNGMELSNSGGNMGQQDFVTDSPNCSIGRPTWTHSIISDTAPLPFSHLVQSSPETSNFIQHPIVIDDSSCSSDGSSDTESSKLNFEASSRVLYFSNSEEDTSDRDNGLYSEDDSESNTSSLSPDPRSLLSSSEDSEDSESESMEKDHNPTVLD